MTTAAAVSAELQDVARIIDARLERIGDEKLAFFLFVWAGGEVNYVSSDADRKQTAKAMREIIAKWEAGVADIPAHFRASNARV